MESTRINARSSTSDGNRIRIRYLISQLIVTIVYGVILFVSSGRTDWGLAWAFLGILLVCQFAPAFIVNPATLKERMVRDNKSGISWDAKISPVMMVFVAVITPLVAGLDARFGWSVQIPLSIIILAMALYVVGNAIEIWAMVNNPFFDVVVHIHRDGHYVVKEGPYEIVRHPGYLGMIISFLVVPLVLGTLWALIPAVISAIILVVRTVLEDQTLQKELPGYKEYSHQVHYRLFPGIW